MRVNLFPKPKWFQPSESSGELFVGKNIISIHDGDAIDSALNNDGRDSFERRYPAIGEHVALSGKKEGLNPQSNKHDDNDPGSYDNHLDYRKQQKENSTNRPRQKPGLENREKTSTLSILNKERRDISDRLAKTNFCISAASRAGLMTNERDCLDDTFDSIEYFACKERTGEIFSASTRSHSPIYFFEQQQLLGEIVEDSNVEGSHDDQQGKIIRIIGNDAKRYESGSLDGRSNVSKKGDEDQFPKYDRSRDRTDAGFRVPVMNRKDGGGDESDIPYDPTLTAAKSVSTTLDTYDSETRASETNCEPHACLDQVMPCYSHQTSTVDSFTYPINSGSSPLDLESGERIVSISQPLQSKRDRLEQLRQNKRDIETRVNLNQSIRQTIVIPRSSVYRIEEIEEAGIQNTEQSKSSTPVSKLQVGSSVSRGQQKEFNCRKRMFLVATVSLISVGLLTVAMALFWPARRL
eukprot:jgi/Psemu1/23740/gm1.23740_g